MDREIAAKRSPLFREEQESYKKQEQPKKEKEKPQPTADTTTTPTDTQKESDMGEYDPLAEEDFTSDGEEQKNQISSIDDIIAYHMDTPSYRAAEAYLESLGLKSQSEQHADIAGSKVSFNGEKPTTTKDLNIAPKKYAENKAEVEGFAGPTNSYERWRKRAEDSESAYISLIKESIARKNDLAKKQERNVRSQAIANALGSLVNVFTANALARKGGYIPIIAQYNKEPDSLLRKSIEGRYAIENESEALLSKLANERRKLEQEFAMQGYKQDVAEANALYKMDYDERKRKQERSDWEAKEEKRHKNRMAEIEAQGENALGVAGVKADNAVKVAEIKGAQKQQAEAEAGAKKTYKVKDKNAQNQFVKATTVSEEKKTNAIGEEVKETKENKNLVPYMNKAYAYFEKNGMSGDEMTKAASVLKEIARTHSGALMSNISDSINEMVKNLIKDKRNFSADQIVQIITNAIEKSKTN